MPNKHFCAATSSLIPDFNWTPKFCASLPLFKTALSPCMQMHSVAEDYFIWLFWRLGLESHFTPATKLIISKNIPNLANNTCIIITSIRLQPMEHGTQWRHRWKTSEKLLYVADQCVFAVTKNFSLGCTYWPCSPGHYFICNSSFVLQTNLENILTLQICMPIKLYLDVQVSVTSAKAVLI